MERKCENNEKPKNRMDFALSSLFVNTASKIPFYEK